jgi:hypothetical protein
MAEHHPPRRVRSARADSRGAPRDGHDRINRAREAAEALFRPKRQTAQPAAADPQPPADPAARKPRILTSAAPAEPEPAMSTAIPASQFSRIRAWVKYGMTISQVAQLYGVAVGEIERIVKA